MCSASTGSLGGRVVSPTLAERAISKRPDRSPSSMGRMSIMATVYRLAVERSTLNFRSKKCIQRFGDVGNRCDSSTGVGFDFALITDG